MTAWQDALFAPRRVAVVGASATPGKAGHLFLNNLAKPEAGFAGEIIAIHPSATEVLGCPSYPSLVLAPRAHRSRDRRDAAGCGSRRDRRLRQGARRRRRRHHRRLR